MRNILITTVLLSIFLPAFASAATINAASCSQQDVQAGMNAAQDGDTVLVPAGSCTWTTGNGFACFNDFIAGTCMKKGIKLQGGNGGETKITFGPGFTRGGLQINPDTSSLLNNSTFEVTGFTFDGAGQTMGNEGLLSIRSSGTIIMSKLKVHNNTFSNVTSKAVVANGAVNGVIYENVFTDVGYSVTAFGYDNYGWVTFERSYGQADNLFVEDNIINFTTDMVDIGGTDHGQGAPGFVFRYNTFDLSNTQGGWVFTIHGLQSMATSAGYTCPSGCGYDSCSPSVAGSCNPTADSCQQWSTIKSEYYGNRIFNTPYLHSVMGHRGSWLIMFYNDIAGIGSAPSLVYAQYACDSCQDPSTPAYSQHVQNSYIFKNLYNGANVKMTKGLDYCADAAVGSPYTITENVDYWNENGNFDGTAGVGIGTLVSRPSGCTAGVGYWATDQSTSNLSGMTGAHPATPISGTFYKCTSQDTWTHYYTPYVYPHPLRNDCVSYPSLCGTGVKTINVSSCSYADVSAAINSANSGDTINVPAGECAWGSRIVINRSLYLIGAGTGRTIINNAYAPSLSGGSLDAAKHLISIVPAVPADNPQIRISGFTFNFGTTSYGIYYANPSTTYDCTNVRLDHLDLSTPNYVLQRYGLAHGVMDNCHIKGWMDGGGSSTLWETNGYEYGTASNFYIENCTWEAYSPTSMVAHAGNGAFRYAFRYNNITLPTHIQTFPLFDQHGNQGQPSCFGAEIYGNTITANNIPQRWLSMIYDQRGGKSLVYDNAVVWTTTGVDAAMRVREEHQDSEGSGPAVNAVNGQPQHISDSYYWNNTKNGAALVPSLSNELGQPCSVCGMSVPTENIHVWLEKNPFNGTAGIGVGPLASRPASCTSEGLAWWATDEKKLYRWRSGAWELYYIPYTYPHPLRTDCVNYPSMCDSDSSPPIVVPGDINGDGVVSIADLSAIGVDFGKRSGFIYQRSDTNGDGVIDVFDMVYVAGRFG